MDERRIFLSIVAGSPLRGVWNAATNVWTHYREGYWKVIAQ